MIRFVQLRPQLIRHPSAFTILELMVATAVMALLLVLFLQMTSHTMQATRASNQQLDSTQEARMVLDVLSSDLTHAVMTDGATVLVQAAGSAPSLAFLTYGRGPATAPTRFLSINYRLDGSDLTRAYSAVGWNSPNLLSAAESASAVSAPVSGGSRAVLASGILQFSVQGLLEDGSLVSLLTAPGPGLAWGASGVVRYDGQTVPSGWTALVPARPPLPSPLTTSSSRVRALLVAIAAVDQQTLQLLTSDQKSKFVQPTISDPVSAWESSLQQNAFPAAAKSSIRFHSKVIPLP